MSARVIWKYEVPLDGEPHDVELPEGSQVVAAGVQGNVGGELTGAYYPPRFYLWAAVDVQGEATTRRRFQWFGTGHPYPEGSVHRGTVHVGGYVWHLIELPA